MRKWAPLVVLALAQFLMVLDQAVMNVSISQLVDDFDTSVTTIQSVITMYSLVMATLMITGGKLGSLWGRRRAFAIGCVIYGAGSLTTALAPNLPVLMLGWSVLEGVGAALIMPAIVALVAANFPPEGRPRAYGLVASAGPTAAPPRPLPRGLVTGPVTRRAECPRGGRTPPPTPLPDAPAAAGPRRGPVPAAARRCQAEHADLLVQVAEVRDLEDLGLGGGRGSLRS